MVYLDGGGAPKLALNYNGVVCYKLTMELKAQIGNGWLLFSYSTSGLLRIFLAFHYRKHSTRLDPIISS